MLRLRCFHPRSVLGPIDVAAYVLPNQTWGMIRAEWAVNISKVMSRSEGSCASVLSA